MLAVLAAAGVGEARAAPLLQGADAAIRFESPTACTVVLSLTVSGGGEIEHRLELMDSAATELLGLVGGRGVGAPRDIGRTRALHVVPAAAGAAYTLRYRVTQPVAHRFRCPIWLPTATTDGRSRGVQIAVTVPAGTTASATMPAFTWTGPRGTAHLAHLPAFVIVPFFRPGEPRPWDITRVMDLATIVSLVGATALWLRRGKGRA